MPLSHQPNESAGSEQGGNAPDWLTPGLYIVATPIGNLGDLSDRARQVMAGAQLIACEDSRVTGKLMRRFGLSTRLSSYHDHNAAKRRPKLIERLKRGEIVALVSDAGTPLISDPGYKLVRDARAAGIPVRAVPGPSAALAALVVSGLPSDQFFFAGFLPAKSGARRQRLDGLAQVPATLIFYESGPRLAAALADMADILGPRPALVARELTKLHEEQRDGELTELAAFYADAGPPKGEIAVVVGPPEDAPVSDEDLEDMLRTALDWLSVKDAVRDVTAQSGRSRRQVYDLALRLKDE